MPTQQIAVIGAGVIGLTTAIRLLEQQHAVTIFAKDITTDLASRAAPAFWIPYKASPQHLILKWAERSLAVFQTLPVAAGVQMKDYLELYPEDNDKPLWTRIVKDYHELTDDELSSKYLSGFSGHLFRIDSSVYLDYLLAWFQRLGGVIQQQTLSHVSDVDVRYLTLINCSGIGASQLVNDPDCYPIRGQYVLVEKQPEIEKITFAAVDEHSYTLIVPRTQDCYLGGTTTNNDWNTAVDDETTQQILRRAVKLEPALHAAQIKAVGVGLRPGRKSVRLEREVLKDGRVVIHNYGHGGAGFTVSWGCADDVVSLVD